MKIAVDRITNPLVPFSSKTGESFLAGFLPAVIGMAFVIGLLIFILAMGAGAIKWIYSGGDKQLLEDARKQILHAIVGVILLFSVLAIVKIIENFFGINILSLDIGSLQVK